MANKMIRVSGRDPISATSKALSVFVDANADGILKTYLATVLSADKDAVSLGGNVALSLRQQTARYNRLFPETSPKTLVPAERLTVLDVTERVLVEWLEIFVSTTSGGFVFAPYANDGGARNTPSMSVTGVRADYFSSATLDINNPHSLFSAVYVPSGMKFVLNRPLELTHGVKVIIGNYNAAGGANITTTYFGGYSLFTNV